MCPPSTVLPLILCLCVLSLSGSPPTFQGWPSQPQGFLSFLPLLNFVVRARSTRLQILQETEISQPSYPLALSAGEVEEVALTPITESEPPPSPHSCTPLSLL